MNLRNVTLIAGVLLAGIFSGSFVQSSGSGRKAKILEDPSIPQWHSSENAALYTSNRGLSVDNNMVLYRSVFTISLKLLTVFLLIKLFSNSVAGGSGGGWHQQPYQTTGWSGQAGGQGQGQGGYQQSQLPALNVNYNPANTVVTATSTGAAAGASTGGAAGVVGLANTGGYISAQGNNPRPSFLLPRFRFGLGGPRHPPFRQPPTHMMMPVAHYNMGEQTQFVETHSNLYVLPDGSQARVPISTSFTGQAKPIDSNTATPTTAPAQNPEGKAASDATAASNKVESVIVSTSSSSSAPQPSAERRSSLAYKERLSQLQQAYEDWNLHFNPGTRSL